MRRLILACAVVFVTGCGGDSTPGELDCGEGGLIVTADGEDFCVYAGFSSDDLRGCPSSLPNVVDFLTGVVCTARPDLPMDSAPDALCESLGTAVSRAQMCSADVSCRFGAACCSSGFGEGCAASNASCPSSCAVENVFCEFDCEFECETGEIPCATGCCAGSVSLDIVDANATANTGSESAIGVDGDGVVHIIYKRTNELVHAHNRTGSWTLEVVDTGGNPSNIFATVEPSGMIHAAYMIGTSPRYAVFTGCGWFTEELPTPALDLGVDLNDGVRVLAGAEVLERTDEGWVRFGNPFPDARSGLTMDIDPIGNLHVPSIEGDSSIQYLVWDPDGWDTFSLAFLPNVGDDFDVAVSACGAQYVSVVGCAFGGENELCIYDRATGNFNTRAFRRRATSHRLAVSPDGTPHVLVVREPDRAGEPDFGDTRTAVTEYARWDGAAWRFVEVVGPTQTVGEGISLAVDDAGAAHIAVFEDGLRYVRID